MDVLAECKWLEKREQIGIPPLSAHLIVAVNDNICLFWTNNCVLPTVGTVSRVYFFLIGPILGRPHKHHGAFEEKGKGWGSKSLCDTHGCGQKTAMFTC